MKTFSNNFRLLTSQKGSRRDEVKIHNIFDKNSLNLFSNTFVEKHFIIILLHE